MESSYMGQPVATEVPVMPDNNPGTIFDIGTFEPHIAGRINQELCRALRDCPGRAQS